MPTVRPMPGNDTGVLVIWNSSIHVEQDYLEWVEIASAGYQMITRAALHSPLLRRQAFDRGRKLFVYPTIDRPVFYLGAGGIGA